MGKGQHDQGAVITTCATVVEKFFMLQGYREHLFNMPVQLRNPDPSFLAPIQTDTTSVLRIGAPSNILCPLARHAFPCPHDLLTRLHYPRLLASRASRSHRDFHIHPLKCHGSRDSAFRSGGLGSQIINHSQY